jgi:hypothetical protein
VLRVYAVVPLIILSHPLISKDLVARISSSKAQLFTRLQLQRIDHESENESTDSIIVRPDIDNDVKMDDASKPSMIAPVSEDDVSFEGSDNPYALK